MVRAAKVEILATGEAVDAGDQGTLTALLTEPLTPIG
jgi:hypothetical protein